MRILQNIPAARPSLLRRLEGADCDEPPEVILQMAISAGALSKGAQALPFLTKVAERHGVEPLIRDAVMTGLAGRELEMLRMLLPRPGFRDEADGLGPMLQALASAVV